MSSHTATSHSGRSGARRERGEQRGLGAVDAAVAGMVEAGDTDLDGHVERVQVAGAVTRHDLAVAGDELVDNALDVAAAGEDRIAVGGHPQRGGADVEQQVLGAPQMSPERSAPRPATV